MNLKEDAKMIANLIENTVTEERGNLFIEIAAQLEKRSQFYTSALIHRIGEIYNQE